MKLSFPFKDYIITQAFSKNYNSYYSEDGLKGHTGLDLKAIGDPTILAAADSYVYSFINKDNPDVMRYRAVYTLVLDNEAGLAYEVSYGHCGAIYAKIGTTVKAGTPLAEEGNTGDVAVGGSKVTRQQKLDYPKIGNHLHLQVRLAKPVEKIVKGMQYLTTQNGPLKYQNQYYEIVNYYNGFAGCIDPGPFLIQNTSAIVPTIRYGDKGEQVKIVQKKVGAFVDGSFGKETEAKVKKYQSAHGLSADGIVGPKTSMVMNQ